MNVQRGDVVLVAFPFSSGLGSKRRPALVVQHDLNNRRMANTIVAAITTTTHRSHEPTQLLIDPGTMPAPSSGLLLPSVVSCENLATIERDLIVRTIGRLATDTMKLVDGCLKAALGLV
jgi:mRNA interferase MazF